MDGFVEDLKDMENEDARLERKRAWLRKQGMPSVMIEQELKKDRPLSMAEIQKMVGAEKSMDAEMSDVTDL